MGNLFYFGRDNDKVIDSLKEAIGIMKILSVVNAFGSILVLISMQYLFFVGSLIFSISSGDKDFSSNLPIGLVIKILAFTVISILMFFWCRRSQSALRAGSKLSYIILAINTLAFVGALILFIVNGVINYWMLILLIQLIINALVLRQVYIYNDINN